MYVTGGDSFGIVVGMLNPGLMICFLRLTELQRLLILRLSMSSRCSASCMNFLVLKVELVPP